MAIKRQLTENGIDIYPVTHQSLVVDDKGVSIGAKLDTAIQRVEAMNEMLNIEVVPEDIDDVIDMIEGL